MTLKPLVSLLLSVAAFGQGPPALSFEVSTDKVLYKTGEPIIVQMRLRNESHAVVPVMPPALFCTHSDRGGITLSTDTPKGWVERDAGPCILPAGEAVQTLGPGDVIAIGGKFRKFLPQATISEGTHQVRATYWRPESEWSDNPNLNSLTALTEFDVVSPETAALDRSADIELSVSTQKRDYSLAEDPQIRMRLVNHGTDTVAFPPPSIQCADTKSGSLQLIVRSPGPAKGWGCVGDEAVSPSPPPWTQIVLQYWRKIPPGGAAEFTIPLSRAFPEEKTPGLYIIKAVYTPPHSLPAADGLKPLAALGLYTFRAAMTSAPLKIQMR